MTMTHYLAQRDRQWALAAYLSASVMLLGFAAHLLMVSTTSPASRHGLAAPLFTVLWWCAAFALYLALFWLGMGRIRLFLNAHHAIDGSEALFALKAVVRNNMVLAYPLLVLGLVTVASALLAIQSFGISGYGCMVAFLVGNVWATRRMKALEATVRGLPARDGALAHAQAAINQRWKKSWWPNF